MVEEETRSPQGPARQSTWQYQLNTEEQWMIVSHLTSGGVLDRIVPGIQEKCCTAAGSLTSLW